jgi:hypothetical protein
MKNVKEVIAMLMIGDGTLALVAPRRHMLLWRFGPESYKRLAEAFARRPALTRLLAAVEVAGGLWLALRQYEER